MDKKFIIVVTLLILVIFLLIFVIYLLFKFYIILQAFCFDIKEMSNQWYQLVEILKEFLKKK